MKVRKMVDDPDVEAGTLSKIIGTDAALSARLLQVANSAFFKGLDSIENVHTAITRLGMVCVRNIVTSLVMEQLFQATKHKAIKHELKSLWVHGTRVAAISNVLAKRFTSLNPDEAMLAGLIHDIGSLPILSRAVDFPDIIADKATLQTVSAKLHPSIGQLILERWHFPEELIKVAAEHENTQYQSSNGPDYVDVVIIANLHSYMGKTNSHKLTDIDWSSIPALEKLNLTPERSIAALAEAQAEIKELQQLLNG